MKLEEKAWKIIAIKRSLTDTNLEYKKLKIKNRNTFNLMNQAKDSVKNTQIMYWNNKEIRDLSTFKKLYDSIQNVYESIKNTYKHECKLLKSMKLSIKERQREISKMNKIIE